MMIEPRFTEQQYRRLSNLVSKTIAKLNPDCDAYREYMSIQDELSNALITFTSAQLDTESEYSA